MVKDVPLEKLGLVEIFHVPEFVFALVSLENGEIRFVKGITKVGMMTFELLAKKHGAALIHTNFSSKESFEKYASTHDFFKHYSIDWENLKSHTPV